MNTKEKKDYIYKYLTDNKFYVDTDYDEFTGRKNIFITSKGDLIFNNDFVDVEFLDIQDSVKDFARYKVDRAYQEAYQNLDASYRQFFDDSGKDDDYEEEIERLRDNHKKRSRIGGTIVYYEDSEKEVKKLLVNVYFSNFSHHRDLSEAKIYIKSKSGNVLCLDKILMTGDHDLKTDISLLTGEVEYRDDVYFELNANDIPNLCGENDISFRFGELDVRGDSFFSEDIFKYLLFLVNQDNISEDELDVVYELVQKDIAHDKRREEEDKICDKIHKIIEELKQLNFYNTENVRKLVSAQNELPQIKLIRLYCIEINTYHRVLEFLDKMPQNYDLEIIKADIDSADKQFSNNKTIRGVSKASCWIFIILTALSFAFHWPAIVTIILLVFGIASNLIAEKYKSKAVYFNQETVNLIEDFTAVLQE